MDDSIAAPAPDQASFVDLTTEIVSAYVSNNSVPAAELPALLSGIHAAIAGLGMPSTSAKTEFEKPTPAKIRKSITHDALISFIDGKPYKTLKRHLTTHGLTLEQYRERYSLPRDYPTTAPSYSEQRSALAKSLGLGQQRRRVALEPAVVSEPVAEAPKPRGRRKAAATTES